MFERFTDRARRVVVLAQEEARMLNHNYIGTEHILLGLIHEGEGVAAKAARDPGGAGLSAWSSWAWSRPRTRLLSGGIATVVHPPRFRENGLRGSRRS